MNPAQNDAWAPHVVLIDGRLYGSGGTREAAIADFRNQTAGATLAMRARMAARATVVAISEEQASDVAEMRDAATITWCDVASREIASSDEEQRWFLNHYDCPCGTSWSSEDDCTCDDRCPACRTSCSPTWSEDA